MILRVLSFQVSPGMSFLAVTVIGIQPLEPRNSAEVNLLFSLWEGFGLDRWVLSDCLVKLPSVT